MSNAQVDKKMLSKAQVDKKMRQLAADKKNLEKEKNKLKLEKENLEQEKNKLKETNEELKKNNKEWEIKYGNLQKEYEDLKKVSRNILYEQYLDLQERLHEIKSCKLYEEFFDQNVLSLQKLLGFAEEAAILSKEKQEYYMWEVIATPMIETVRKMGGEIKGRVLLLPEDTGAFDREGIKKDISEVELTELGKYIREDALEERQGKIALQKKAIVRELGNLITELEKLDAGLPVDEEKVKRLAQETRMILEENGIYPMFANDNRLEGYHELQKRFSFPNAYSIHYPGLYIQREGVWEVLGAHIGMDIVERKISGN